METGKGRTLNLSYRSS